jgi:hypothetical protein
MRKNGNHSANHHHQQSQLPPTPPHQQSNKGNSSSSSNSNSNNHNKPSILHARSKSVNSIAIPEHDVVPDSSAASSSTMTAHIAASSSDPTQRIQYYASGSTELATETPVTLTRLEAVRFALRI